MRGDEMKLADVSVLMWDAARRGQNYTFNGEVMQAEQQTYHRWEGLRWRHGS